jgi:hypothetical protein
MCTSVVQNKYASYDLQEFVACDDGIYTFERMRAGYLH